MTTLLKLATREPNIGSRTWILDDGRTIWAVCDEGYVVWAIFPANEEAEWEWELTAHDAVKLIKTRTAKHLVKQQTTHQ